MSKDPVNLPILTRLRIYAVNFVFNGFMGMFLFFMFIWLVLPTSFFFKYSSVEPIVAPISIQADHIDMVSNILANNTSGNFYWNDVLRCNYEMNPIGYFQYVGQWDTSIESSRVTSVPYLSPWTYSGVMPNKPAICQMNSTVTRYVYNFIPKQQFIKSEMFIITK